MNMETKPKGERCSVLSDNCKAATLDPGYDGTRAECFGCGLPVCSACSRRRKWYSYGRRRICLRCIDESVRNDKAQPARPAVKY